MARSRIELEIAADLANFYTGLRNARDFSANTFEDIASRARSVGAAFGGLAAGGGVLSTAILTSTAQLEDLRQGFAAVTGSTEVANRKMAFLYDFVKTTKFELPEVAEASLKLEALGYSAEKMTPVIGKLSAVMNKDIKDAAAIVGKALLGSRRSITQLKDSYGITSDELGRFGAKLDANGLVVNKGAENIDRLRKAFINLVETKYGKIFEAQSKNISVALTNLKDTAKEVAASFGETVSPDIVAAAKAAGEWIDGLKKMDPEMKRALTSALLLGTTAAGVATGIAGLVAVGSRVVSTFRDMGTWIGESTEISGALGGRLAYLRAHMTAAADAAEYMMIETVLLNDGLQGLISGTFDASIATARLTASSEALLGALAPVAAMAAFTELHFKYLRGSIFDVTDQAGAFEKMGGLVRATWRNALDALRGNVSLEDLRNQSLDINEIWKEGLKGRTVLETVHSDTAARSEVQRLKFLYQNRDLVGKSAQEVIAAGKNEMDIKKMILGYDLAIANAKREGADTSKLENERKQLEGILPALAGTYRIWQKLQGEKSFNATNLFSEASRDLEEFNEKRKENIYETKAEELKAMDEVRARLAEAADAIAAYDVRKKEEALNSIRALDLDRPRLYRAVRKQEADDAIAEVKREAQERKITKAQEAASLRKLADEYKDVHGIQRKLNAEAKDLDIETIKEVAEAKSEALKIESKLLEQRESGFEKELKKGRNVEANTKKAIEAINEQLAVEKQLIQVQLEADLAATANEEQKSNIKKRAILETKQAEEKAAQSLKSISDTNLALKEAEIKRQNELTQAIKDTSDARLNDLESRFGRGENVGKELVAEIKVRQKLEKQILDQSKAEALLHAQGPKEKKNVNDVYREKEKKAEISNKEEIRVANEKIQKRNIEDKQKSIDLAKKEADLRKMSIEEQKSKGINTKSQEISLVEEKLSLEEQSLKAKSEEEQLGKSKTQQALLEKQLTLDIQSLRQQAKKDIDDINKAYKQGQKDLQSQKDELKSINDELDKLKGDKAKDEKDRGPAMSVEEFANSNKRDQDIYDLESKKRRKESELSDAEKRQKALDLNEAEGERTGRLYRGGKNTAEAARDVELRAVEESKRQEREKKAEEIKQAGRAQAEQRLKQMGKSDEEIVKILGQNFDNKVMPLEKGLPTPPEGYRETQAKSTEGGDDKSTQILSSILQLISQYLGKPVPPPTQGPKPKNQLKKAEAAETGPMSPGPLNINTNLDF